MKIGDLIKVNTDDPNFTGTWIIVEKIRCGDYKEYYKYRAIGAMHDGTDSDIVLDGEWAERNMRVISL